jgi:cytosine/adenosine deaminase-related metal-dependent hydrolase
MIYLARWVVPIARPAFENGAVGVRGGRITFVGPAAEAPADDVVDLGDCALLPGLVNTHTHLELTVMRGWLEELPFRRWIIRLTKARQEVLNQERLLASARVGIAEGLLSGITTYADTCESGVVHTALREMGVRGAMYLEVFGPQPEQSRQALKDLATKVAKHRAADTQLVRTGISPHAPYSVSDALFNGASEMAIAEKLPVAIHAAESEAEQRLVTEGEGDFADALRARSINVMPRATSTISLLDRTRMLRARPLLIHCVRVDADDLHRIADHGCKIAHCPASNAKLGHGAADLCAMLEANVAVGLGSDSVASNNRMDVLDEARLAVLFARATRRQFDAIPTVAAIDLATRGGATALGLDAEVGTIEVGKAADLAAFPMDEAYNLPMQDPESALLWATSGRGAKFVAVNGRELVRNGKLTIDIAESVAMVKESASDLRRFSS